MRLTLINESGAVKHFGCEFYNNIRTCLRKHIRVCRLWRAETRWLIEGPRLRTAHKFRGLATLWSDAGAATNVAPERRWRVGKLQHAPEYLPSPSPAETTRGNGNQYCVKINAAATLIRQTLVILIDWAIELICQQRRRNIFLLHTYI